MKMNLLHLKKILGLVILRKRQNTNKNPDINALSMEFDSKNIVLIFLQIESYGALDRQKPKQFTTNGTACFKHLQQPQQKNCNKH